MRWLTALALCLVLLAPGPVRRRAATAGGGDFCSTASTNIFCLDFEPTATCATNGANATNGSPSCQYATGPLGGTYSMRATDDAVNDYAEWTDDFTTTSDVRLMFSFKIESDDGATDDVFPLIQIREGTTVWAWIGYRASGNALISKFLTSGLESTDSDALTVGTEYTVCLEYDRAGFRSRVQVDAADTYTCAGAVTGTGYTDVGSTQPTNLNALRIKPDGYDPVGYDYDVVTSMIDDLIIVEGTF